MSIPLTALLDNASQGSNLTCTLSAESVQVIFFALSFLESDASWQEDWYDTISDAERLQITELLENVSQEILP